jgi:hypothetical protein
MTNQQSVQRTVKKMVPKTTKQQQRMIGAGAAILMVSIAVICAFVWGPHITHAATNMEKAKESAAETAQHLAAGIKENALHAKDTAAVKAGAAAAYAKDKSADSYEYAKDKASNLASAAYDKAAELAAAGYGKASNLAKSGVDLAEAQADKLTDLKARAAGAAAETYVKASDKAGTIAHKAKVAVGLEEPTWSEKLADKLNSVTEGIKEKVAGLKK